MALRDVDTLDKAIRVAIDVAEVRAKWGKQARIPYHEDQIYDALVILHKEGARAGELLEKYTEAKGVQEQHELLIAELREQLTKSNRQLAAANARAARATKKETTDDV